MSFRCRRLLVGNLWAVDKIKLATMMQKDGQVDTVSNHLPVRVASLDVVVNDIC